VRDQSNVLDWSRGLWWWGLHTDVIVLQSPSSHVYRWFLYNKRWNYR